MIEIIENLTVEDLAQTMVSLQCSKPSGKIVDSLPKIITTVINMIKTDVLKNAPDLQFITSDSIAKIDALSDIFSQAQPQHKELTVYINRFKKFIDEALAARCEYQNKLFFSKMSEFNKNIQEREKIHLQVEKKLLEYKIIQVADKLEKINLIQSACEDYKAYLRKSVVHSYPFLTKNLDDKAKEAARGFQIKGVNHYGQIGLSKLYAINQMQTILTQDASLDNKLINFEIKFNDFKHIISQRRDTPTTLFLKIVGTILSLGCAAPWLWAKPKGANLAKSINQTLLGNNSRIHKTELGGEPGPSIPNTEKAFVNDKSLKLRV